MERIKSTEVGITLQMMIPFAFRSDQAVGSQVDDATLETTDLVRAQFHALLRRFARAAESTWHSTPASYKDGYSNDRIGQVLRSIRLAEDTPVDELITTTTKSTKGLSQQAQLMQQGVHGIEWDEEDPWRPGGPKDPAMKDSGFLGTLSNNTVMPNLQEQSRIPQLKARARSRKRRGYTSYHDKVCRSGCDQCHGQCGCNGSCGCDQQCCRCSWRGCSCDGCSCPCDQNCGCDTSCNSQCDHSCQCRPGRGHNHGCGLCPNGKFAENWGTCPLLRRTSTPFLPSHVRLQKAGMLAKGVRSCTGKGFTLCVWY